MACDLALRQLRRHAKECIHILDVLDDFKRKHDVVALRAREEILGRRVFVDNF